MRKLAREELTSIPNIYEEERKKLLNRYGDATPQDIASKTSMFRGKSKDSHGYIHLEGEWTKTKLGSDVVLWMTCRRRAESSCLVLMLTL